MTLQRNALQTKRKTDFNYKGCSTLLQNLVNVGSHTADIPWLLFTHRLFTFKHEYLRKESCYRQSEKRFLYYDGSPYSPKIWYILVHRRPKFRGLFFAHPLQSSHDTLGAIYQITTARVVTYV